MLGVLNAVRRAPVDMIAMPDRKTIWETQHRMPILLWMCKEMHPPQLKESLGPSNWRRLALDAEVGRYMPGVRR